METTSAGKVEMATPREVIDLIKRFQENRDVYCSSQYNEAQARIEFIDPLFKALGWDMTNEKGYAEAYKEVIHEDAIKVGGATKAPDYAFRIGGVRKFFVEAKRPGLNIKEDGDAAYQLRRYAWSAKLPLSVVTDFEEFAVYDSRIKPAKTDKASLGRVLYLTLDEYNERWDEIAQIFSQEAILTGSFDKYVESSKKKRGTAEVDTAFLKEIEAWRDVLARNIALRNGELSTRELNYAVQRTIDRIIFLRICEDRGIEDYGQLMALRNGTNIYQRLCQIFRRADERYNSGLFHFTTEKDRLDPPDSLTLSLTIDDNLIKGIIKGLYYPESPFEFSVLPADILGHIYEQFLGKVIRLTPGHHAKVEDKPEVKKAGGVYYTPTYIVDYIVKNTVGKLLEQNTPTKVSGLRILDPACGSGSFLLGAYQTLLDWHQEWYQEHDPEKHAKGRSPKVYLGPGGEWRLTTPEKKRILLNSIYGVDIDTQAVEVTKLSLLLKVLEGENAETLGKNLRLFHERALPDLGDNIKCGNSLIGPDFYEGKQMSLLDEEERYRINAFDWNAEFSKILQDGGFDAVIGNPPWGADFSALEVVYLRSAFQAAQGKVADSYALFMECALGKLKVGGLLSHITPDTFLRKEDHLPIRQLLLGQSSIQELTETGPLFSKARDTWCLVFVTAKTKPDSETRILHRKISRFVVSAEERLARFGRNDWDKETKVPQSVWQVRPNLIVGYLASTENQNLISKLESFPSLGDLSATLPISRGEEGSKFALREAPYGNFYMVVPANVERFNVSDGIRIHMNSLTSTKVVRIYTHPKLWIIRIQKLRWKQRLVCGLDPRFNSAGMKTLQAIVSTRDDLKDLKYLLGLLASQLMNYWCINFLADDMNKSYLKKLPIRPIDLEDPRDTVFQERMVELVDGMQCLHQQLVTARTDHDKKLIQRQIHATDKQIDQLVYELYSLTDKEIRIVEDRRGGNA